MIVSLILFIASMYIYPEKTSQFIGYRFYTVLTDSMEPTIPTNSLVLTKVLPKEQALKPNTIITFKANRFGEHILLTHYFRKTQEKDGITYYRTQPEGKDIKDESTYDMYETKRSDIIGTYVIHVPYVGKIILFLQSKFGLLMFAELIIIWLVNKLVKTKWEEKEKKQASNTDEKHKIVNEDDVVMEQYNQEDEVNVEPLVYLSESKVQQNNAICIVEAIVHNHTTSPLNEIEVLMTMYDINHIMIKQSSICVASKAEIKANTSHHFAYKCNVSAKVEECVLSIKNY